MEEIQLQKKYIKARTDRSGAQVHDDLFAYAYCFKNNLTFTGSLGLDNFENHFILCKIFNIPLPKKIYNNDLGEKMCKDYRKYDADLFSKKFLNHIHSKVNYPIPFRNKTYNVVVHVRRGDINPKKKKCKYAYRYLYNSYYTNIINMIKKYKSTYKLNITILSEKKSYESLDCFSEYNILLNKNLTECWEMMYKADILVISKSSFSYVPAIYNKNIVIYTLFWHKKLENWLDSSSSIFDKDLDHRMRMMRQQNKLAKKVKREKRDLKITK